LNRVDWQRVAEEKIRAAHALLAAGEWASTYYLAGYAVECGLKSCVLARVLRQPELLFTERDYQRPCWTHDLEDLMSLAGLTADWTATVAATPPLATSWTIVAGWDESSRYRDNDQIKATQLLTAISDATNGVMPWIRVRW